jgi:hypothetical protein
MFEQYIDPAQLTVYRNDSRNLCVHIHGRGEWDRVTVRRALPYTDPDRYIAFYSGDEEIGIVRTIDALDFRSRNVLSDALRKRYHVPEIRRILAIDEVQNATRWHVDTDRGMRSFEVQSRRSFRRLPDGGLVIIDVDSNRYRISDRRALDHQSLELLDAQV